MRPALSFRGAPRRAPGRPALPALAVALLAIVLLAPLPAAADPVGRGSGIVGGSGRHGALSGPYPGRTAPTPAERSLRLDRFQRSRRSAARVRLQETARDAERRVEEQRLLRQGSPAEVRAYQRRLRTEDGRDALRQRVEWAALDRAWLASLGPATRRVIERSALRRRRLVLEHERDLRVEELERAVEERPPAPPFWETGSQQPRLGEPPD